MCTTYVICILLSSVPAKQPLDRTGFLAESKLQETAVVNFLHREDIWAPTMKQQLLDHLKVAAVVRPIEAVPVLLRRLSYTDEAARKSDRPTPPSLVYPVYGAINAYGAAAVPHIMAHLKSPLEVEKQKEWAIESMLLIMLLTDLSDDTLTGQEFARLRLKRELGRDAPKQYPKITSLLSHKHLVAQGK